MVNEKGWFKFRKDQSLKNTCDYDEIVKECRAQVERCIRLLGKAPDYTHAHLNSGIFEKARHQVCDEYGIKYGFCTKMKALIRKFPKMNMLLLASIWSINLLLSTNQALMTL